MANSLDQLNPRLVALPLGCMFLIPWCVPLDAELDLHRLLPRVCDPVPRQERYCILNVTVGHSTEIMQENSPELLESIGEREVTAGITDIEGDLVQVLRVALQEHGAESCPNECSGVIHGAGDTACCTVNQPSLDLNSLAMDVKNCSMRLKRPVRCDVQYRIDVMTRCVPRKLHPDEPCIVDGSRRSSRGGVLE